MKKLGKRGIWENLSVMTMGIVTFCVVAAIGALVLATFRTNIPKTDIGCPALYQLNGTANCLLTSNTSQPAVATTLVADGNASLTTAYGQAGASNITSWIPVIVVVAVGAILIAMVAGFFVRKRN